MDVHAHNCAPSTYIGSANRRIDYMFGSPTIVEAVKRSGTLSYIEGPQADHRAMYLDLDPLQVLAYNPGRSSHSSGNDSRFEDWQS